MLTALVRREVSEPIEHVADCLRDIAHGEGDLTKRIDHAAQNEIGAVAQSFNEFADKLSLIIIQVREATGAVSDAAAQLSSSAQELSRGTSEQAADPTAADARRMTHRVYFIDENHGCCVKRRGILARVNRWRPYEAGAPAESGILAGDEGGTRAPWSPRQTASPDVDSSRSAAAAESW